MFKFLEKPSGASIRVLCMGRVYKSFINSTEHDQKTKCIKTTIYTPAVRVHMNAVPCSTMNTNGRTEN